MSEVRRYTFKGAVGEYVYSKDFDRVTAVRDELQVLLTAADERAYVLEGLLRLLAELPGVRTSGMWERVIAALNPAEGGGDVVGRVSLSDKALDLIDEEIRKNGMPS